MERDHLSRKLAVILHADVVGSTSLVQIDEALAHQRIQATFNNFSKTIESYGGLAREIRGDALVAEFDRASDAVTAAITFQTLNEEINATVDDEIKPELRIGISLGEVIVADSTLTGAGVVLAQRLEQLAEPGGVVVQGSVSETVPTRLPFEFENLGKQMLKGFDQPVRAFAAILKSGEEPPAPHEQASQHNAESSDPQIPDEPSIAVLPFTNMSGDPEQEYFSDGITEDIITALSRISGLLVVARNSTMAYKGQAIDVKEVAHEQGVRYVLEGSVRKGGNRIRITAQLIDATTGHHLWADRYDRDLTDIFTVQDEITHMITVETQVKVTEGEQARLWAGGTNDVGAWERIFRATELKDNEIREDNIEGHRLAIEALKIDPQYARGWVVLGFLHWNDAFWGWTESREASLAEASEAAQKAQQLETDFPDALALQAHIYRLKGEHDRAVKAAQKAVILSPNHSENTAGLAIILTCAGRAEEAVEKFKRAIRLCPVYPAWYLVLFGSCYYSMGDQDRAISTLKEAVDMEPDSAFARVWLCCALVAAGLIEDARQVAKEVLRIDPTFIATNYQGAIFKDPEIGRQIIENLLQAGIPR